LAIDPPDESWDEDRRRLEFELAENSLLDAIDKIDPGDDERRESPLNLQVSLALTCDARARFEEQFGNLEQAATYRERAERGYRSAQGMDAENSYVLENFARYKLRIAHNASPGEERTRLIVEAIDLLELERESEEGARREEPVLTELADAYNLLREGDGEQLLLRLASKGSEAAAVALARLSLRATADKKDEVALEQAERMLLQVPALNVTWRSRVLLYRIVSTRTSHDFKRRLEILDELESLGDLVWPLQLRLEYGILLFQVGDHAARKKGQEVFRRLREDLPERSGSVRVPDELRFLRDPATGFRDRLRTSMVVKNTSDTSRNYFAVPEGWHAIEIPFRHYLFGGSFRRGAERDCYVQFTNFGPQAVPITTE